MLQEIFEYPFLVRILNKTFNDNDKIKLISLNKFLNSKRTKFTYDKRIFINLTVKETIDCWTSIRDGLAQITGIHHRDGWYYNCLTNITTGDIFKFPDSITNLSFSCYFDQPILNCIPNSVTHLTLGDYFNQPILNCIPNSVTHLTLGDDFNQTIKDGIPNSVTHLTIKNFVSEEIENLSNVTHLIITTTETKKVKFPHSLVFLRANENFLEFNKENISSNIKVKLFNYGWY